MAPRCKDEEERRQKRIEANRRYREKNKEKINKAACERRKKNGRKDDAEYNRELRLRHSTGTFVSRRPVYKGRNKEKEKESKKKYLERDGNKERQNAQVRKWQKENREKANKHASDWRKRQVGTGNQADLNMLLRARLKYIKKAGGSKCKKALEYIGCTYEQWIDHLGPDYTNMKTLKLNIDHIWPLSLYDLTKESEQLKCFNYKNTRLCPAKENKTKKDAIPAEALALTVPRNLWPIGYEDLYSSSTTELDSN